MTSPCIGCRSIDRWGNGRCDPSCLALYRSVLWGWAKRACGLLTSMHQAQYHSTALARLHRH